jgi:uncharacterized protein YbaP (TraB family)
LDEDESFQEVHEILIMTRNHKMVEKIEGFLKSDNNYFVVVGSGHVVGKEGIISLLREKGYAITQE